MKNAQIKIFLSVVGILIVGSIITFMLQRSKPVPPGKYDVFATCLKDKGAIFYGAWWCSHCNAQKEAFGSSKKFLPYVECSTKSGDEQLQICKDKKIEGYPTWEFANGERIFGEVPLETLAEKTSCELPQ